MRNAMVGVALMAAMSLAGGDRFCPQPMPEPPSRIEQYMADRREFGFRADRAYVRKLVRRGMWEYDVGYMPATPRENRYLRLRDRLRLGPHVERYLRRHPHLSGGVSVEDDWPREPYLLVRVTRNADRYQRFLRRLARFPDNLRTKRVARSERSLRRLQDRIDFEAHEPDGFHVASTRVDIDRSEVVIELITQRQDGEAFFRARYGPSVTTRVIATELTSPECAGLFGYRPAPDGNSLTIVYESGGGATFDHVEVVERPDRVEIAVVVQAPNGFRTGESQQAEQVVSLAAPLAGRRVIDTQAAKPLPALRP